jgi:CcmD family protein
MIGFTRWTLQRVSRLAGAWLPNATVAIVLVELQDAFEKVKPGEIQESLPATPFVFAAYAFVWIALAFYVFIMWSRLKRVERDLADVRAKLQRSSQ